MAATGIRRRILPQESYKSESKFSKFCRWFQTVFCNAWTSFIKLTVVY